MKELQITEQERRFLHLIHNTPEDQLETLFSNLGLLDEFRKIKNG